MTVGILGKKVGMTQIFDENGRQIPVTVIKVDPTFIVQKRTMETDGYTAVQIGSMRKNKCTKALNGHFQKAGLEPQKVLCEIRTESTEAVAVGDRILLDTFEKGDYVNITTTTIGKGYQGVMKRHGYAGGPRSHGSDFHRQTGGVGSRAGGKGCAKNVRKGRPMPGQMGNKRKTIQNLEVVDVDIENSLLVVKGNVPGAGNNVVTIRNSFRYTPQKDWKVEKPVQHEAEEKETQEGVKQEAGVVETSSDEVQQDAGGERVAQDGDVSEEVTKDKKEERTEESAQDETPSEDDTKE